MEKRVVKFKVDFNFEWTDGVEIKKIKEDLDALEKIGVEEIEIKADDEWGYPFVAIEAYIARIETEEECMARVNKENEAKESIIRRELHELKRLKAKYGEK